MGRIKDTKLPWEVWITPDVFSFDGGRRMPDRLLCTQESFSIKTVSVEVYGYDWLVGNF